MHLKVLIISILMLVVVPHVTTTNECIEPGSAKECSNRGSCDNFSCDRHNDAICSGPQYGVCSCGTCVCVEGRAGSACECPTTNQTCIAPRDVRATDQILCSGRGECVCGDCRCGSDPETMGRYYGYYCERAVGRRL